MAGEASKVDGETVGLIMAGLAVAGAAWHVISRVARTEKNVEQNAEAVHGLAADIKELQAVQRTHATDLALQKQSQDQILRGLAELRADMKAGFALLQERMDRKGH